MKRWILRSFFIGLLLICAGGWVFTLNRSFHFTVTPLAATPRPYPRTTPSESHPAAEAEQTFVITAYDGSLIFRHHQFTSSYSDGTPLPSPTFTFSRDFPEWFPDAEEELHAPSANILGFRFFSGFIGGRWTSGDRSYIWKYQTYFAVPFWFWTAIFSVLLWLAWRKTRHPMKGRAFPVVAKS